MQEFPRRLLKMRLGWQRSWDLVFTKKIVLLNFAQLKPVCVQQAEKGFEKVASWNGQLWVGGEGARYDFLPCQVLVVVFEWRLASQQPVQDNADGPLVNVGQGVAQILQKFGALILGVGSNFFVAQFVLFHTFALVEPRHFNVPTFVDQHTGQSQVPVTNISLTEKLKHFQKL